jgi:hypothetical protein
VAVTERLAVGSSRITTLGLETMARAMATDCWRPPESVSTFRRTEATSTFSRFSTADASSSMRRRSTNRPRLGQRPRNILLAMSMFPHSAKS